MKKVILSAVLAAMVLSFTGCGSPKDASKDNFKNVLNGYFERNCIIVAPMKTSFPVTLRLNDVEINQYEALAKVGLLDVKEGNTQLNDYLSFGLKKTVPAKIYTLSQKGKESFMKNSGKGFLGGKEEGFCAANYQVDEISNFSEPAQSMGYTISKVNYSASPKNIKEWAKNESIIKAFPRLTKELQPSQNASAALVLMNDGWVHEREMSK